MARYVPKQGDFVGVSFDPQSDDEQREAWRAFVVSRTTFNRHTGMAILCSLTNTSRNYPFHVAVPARSKLAGYIMVEQIKSVDYASRKVRFVAKAPQAVVDEVLGILDACVYEAG